MAASPAKQSHMGMEARLPRTPTGETKKPGSQIWKGFVQGSIGAAVGGCCAHPLDLIKMGGSVFRSDGISGLFKGVDASAARQLVYSGVRFGMYDVFKKAAGEETAPLSMFMKVLCAGSAGAIGAFAGNPGDLAMVRMQSDGKLPVEQRRGYRNIFDAVSKIAKTEGVLSMWKTGVVPNMNRATIITIGQLAFYDQCKELLVSKAGMKEGIPTHFSASLMAAFIASAMSNPVDVAKTRLMNQAGGEIVYTGTMNCLTTMVAKEGPLSLYKGFAATFARQCPYVVITWLSVEQLKKIMKDW